MNLINKQVKHKSFGEGSIVYQSDFYMEIHFKMGNKRFVYPDAFDTHLTLIDDRAQNVVKKLILEREKERGEVELKLKKEKALRRKEQHRIFKRKKFISNLKAHPSLQAVFWCKSQEERDRVFMDWNVFTGVIKSGSKKGQPNRLVRMNPSSACLLTSREPNMPENDRIILGVFMVDEDFLGNLCEDGYIPAHLEYRLSLSEQESKKMLFWNYYANKRYPNKMTWNTGRYRYFDNIMMAQILRDIVSMKKQPQEKEFAQRFFDYFCRMNKIDQYNLPNLNGALTTYSSAGGSD